MNFKSLLDEAIERGERMKDEVLDELLKSKTLHEVVSNRNFIKAISRVIETKEEIKRTISKQVKSIFLVMDVPTKSEIAKIGNHIVKLENIISKLGEKKIPVKSLRKTKTKTKTKSKAKPTRKTAKRKTTKTAAAKKRKTTTKKKTTAKRKTTTTKTAAGKRRTAGRRRR